MKISIFIILCLIIIIIYLIKQIEQQKLKIIYLSRKNSSILKNNPSKNINCLKPILNTEIKFIPINPHIAYIKNPSYIKIAPFDFAPKISDIAKNTNIKIISKVLINNEHWYEIIINNTSLPYKLKGWTKDSGIDFIYPSNIKIIENTKNTF